MARLPTLDRSAVVIQVAGQDGATVLHVTGELDIAARTQMEEALERASCEPGRRLTVDVSGLRFIDASGLGLFVAAHNRLVDEGCGGIVVKGASGMVRRVFAITALTSLLDSASGSAEPPEAPESPEAPEAFAARLPRRRGSEPPDLERARRESGLELTDLFVAYFGLGGTADLPTVAAHLGGAPMDGHQHDVVVHALNERFIELGRSERLLAYAADRSGPGTR